jgi:hypothetical protein
VSRQGSYGRRTPRHRNSRCSAGLPDAGCQAKYRPDDGCNGICLPDEKCPCISLLDAECQDKCCLQTTDAQASAFWTSKVHAFPFWMQCHEPGETGYLAPPPKPPPPSPHCDLSLSPPPWPQLSNEPRRNILALTSIAPVAIFCRTSTWLLAGQGPPACFLTVTCLPHFTLCCVYCLPRCFLTVACLPRFTRC